MQDDRSYRLYELCHEGRIRGASNREFPDDGEALAHAREKLGFHPAIEVWQEDRLVARLSR
jgi:hypothetical protein